MAVPFWICVCKTGILCGIFLCGSLLYSQGVTGSGYTAPAPVPVSPGDVVTFYVSNPLSASSTPTAGIIGAMLLQGSAGTSVPIESLRGVSNCPDVTSVCIAACGSLLAITVQIPYELIPICPECATPVSAVPPVLVVSGSGMNPSAFELNPLADAVHMLKACDVALGAPGPMQPNLTGLPCAPLVTHADGSLVSAASPAKMGEALTAWAFGLGATNPPAATGQIATATPVTGKIYLNFNYSVNALATKPVPVEPDQVPLVPLFAGLAPGYVGLYQVNFTVPAGAQNGIAPCSLPGTVGVGGNPVQSNLTVSIGGLYSFDGAGICVTAPTPVD